MKPRHIHEAGFYGKVRTHGDFVGQGLARDFVAQWDRWLQTGMLKTRERFGDAWLGCYLAMPLWHFAVRPGIVGERGYVGVMMPGIDAVGRYFPFAIARAVAHAGEQARVRDGAPGAAWHEAAARLALSSLGAGFSLTAFETALAALPVHETHAATMSLPSAGDADSVWWHPAAGESGPPVRHRHDGPLDAALFLRLLGNDLD